MIDIIISPKISLQVCTVRDKTVSSWQLNRLRWSTCDAEQPHNITTTDLGSIKYWFGDFCPLAVLETLPSLFNAATSGQLLLQLARRVEDHTAAREREWTATARKNFPKASAWWHYSSGSEHYSSYRTNQLVSSQGLIIEKLGEANPAITQHWVKKS